MALKLSPSRVLQMSNCQNTLITAAIAGLVGSMAREVSAIFLHPVLSWLAKQFLFRGAEEPEESLRVIRLLDEICERGKLLNEAELLGILGISKKRLHQLWKQGNAIRPGYTVKHQEGCWLVQHDQSEP